MWSVSMRVNRKTLGGTTVVRTGNTGWTGVMPPRLPTPPTHTISSTSGQSWSTSRSLQWCNHPVSCHIEASQLNGPRLCHTLSRSSTHSTQLSQLFLFGWSFDLQGSAVSVGSTCNDLPVHVNVFEQEILLFLTISSIILFLGCWFFVCFFPTVVIDFYLWLDILTISPTYPEAV